MVSSSSLLAALCTPWGPVLGVGKGCGGGLLRWGGWFGVGPDGGPPEGAGGPLAWLACACWGLRKAEEDVKKISHLGNDNLIYPEDLKHFFLIIRRIVFSLGANTRRF